MYEKLAMDIMMVGVKVADIEGKYGFVFRKGKDAYDIMGAIRKTKKNGNAKVENELGLLEIYLKGILKKAPVKKGEPV